MSTPCVTADGHRRLNFLFMGGDKPGTVSAAPLFAWFNADKTRRRKFVQAGYTDARITNWRTRGIPRAEVGPVADLMGLKYEQYVAAAANQDAGITRRAPPDEEQLSDGEKLLLMVRCFLDTDVEGKTAMAKAVQSLGQARAEAKAHGTVRASSHRRAKRR